MFVTFTLGQYKGHYKIFIMRRIMMVEDHHYKHTLRLTWFAMGRKIGKKMLSICLIIVMYCPLLCMLSHLCMLAHPSKVGGGVTPLS